MAALGAAAAELGLAVRSRDAVARIRPEMHAARQRLAAGCPGDALFRAARKAFPDAGLGGGMFSYFTELNRKRPPLRYLDLVGFTTSALVHAGDDISVMEGLEPLPAITASAREIAGGHPLCGRTQRHGHADEPLRRRADGEPAQHPSGDEPQRPAPARSARRRLDTRLLLPWPRRRPGDSLRRPHGTHGIVHARQSWPQPWFDDNGGLFPVFHVLRGLARIAGRPMIATDISAPTLVQGVAARTAAGLELWLANLTAERRQIAVEDMAGAKGAVLEADDFEAGAADPGLLDRLKPMQAVQIGPFAVARLVLPT